MHPEADPDFDARMKLDRLVLREGGNASSVASLDDAMSLILSADRPGASTCAGRTAPANPRC